jgi:hypothetical protein
MTTSTRLLDRLILPKDLPAKNVDFEWNGPGLHFAPLNATPLSKALMGKTNSALCTLCAGALVWGARRLEMVTEASPAYLIAEALLLWEDDPRYYHHPGPSSGTRPSGQAYEAIVDLFRETTSIFKDSPGRHISDPPVQTVENVFSVVRQVLGPDWIDPFRKWTTQAIAKLDLLAVNTHQDFTGRFDHESEQAWEVHKALNMGRPIAIEVLNPGDVRWDSLHSDNVYGDFMTSVDWQQNRYLASPEHMTSLGFPGTPYNPKAR